MDSSISSDGSELFGLSLGLGAFEELVAAGFGHDDIQGSYGPVSDTTLASSTSISTNGANAINGVGQAHHTSSGSLSPQHNPSSGSRTPLDDALSRVSSNTDLQYFQQQQQQQQRRIQERRHSQKGIPGSQNGQQIGANGHSHGQELEQLSVGGEMFGQDVQKRGAHGHEVDQQQQKAQQHNQHHQQQQSSSQQVRADQMNLEALQQLQLLAMQNLPLLSTDNNPGPQQQSQQQQQQTSLQLGNLSLPNLANMGNMGNMSSIQSVQTSSGSASPSTALLEQQIRLNQLQQLQQLQAQIFQQQIELISGQSTIASGLDVQAHQGQMFREFQGLPTPANSTELRAQPNSNFVSPMILQNFMAQPPNSSPLEQFNSPNPLPHGTSSAPAHLAFHTNLPSSADVGGYDFSPITSPWLEPYQQPDHSAPTQRQHQQQHQPSQQLNQGGLSTPQVRATRSSTKRGASSSGEDTGAEGHGHGQQVRKRALPSVRSTATAGSGGSGAGQRGRHARGSASLTSTPAMRARSRKDSSAAMEDTPSPVDLSMPPPAPPLMSGVESSDIGQQGQQEQGRQMSPTSPATIAPVTPAAIMGLGRLGLSSGLTPLDGAEGSTSTSASASSGAVQGKRKSSPKTQSTAGASTSRMTTTTKKASPSSLVGQSPSLKPLLPGGLPPSSAMHLATASNYTHHLSGSASSLNLTPSAPLPQPTLQVRKTSHKAAEQKRRDSLKNSFDDLRFLLPPLPLPNDENYDGEPPLPGALPPRGPPRGEVQGPNRAVSKLQLLRCGNDFIRRLKARVSRRDEYIDQLKTEVRALRARLDEKAGPDLDELEDAIQAFERVDLDKDLDAEEANAPKLGGIPLEGDEDDDGAD